MSESLIPSKNQQGYGTFRPEKKTQDEIKSVSQAPFNTFKIVLYIALWYALNILYNIHNKETLQMLPLPWTVGVSQLFIGWSFFISSWIFKFHEFPRINNFENLIKSFVPQGIFHLCVHIGAVLSMELGTVSFTHIVKAGEPITTSILGFIVLRKLLSIEEYLTLIPIISGVALASVKELSFTWVSFFYAMISNIGSSGRSVFIKKSMEDTNNKLSSNNEFAIMTIVASLISLPMALFFEGPIIIKTWEKATSPDSPFTPYLIFNKLILSSVWYYFYNLVAFYCLEELDLVAHSIANTLKRVVVIISSILFFKTPVTVLGSLGSAIAILGTFLFTIVSKNKKSNK